MTLKLNGTTSGSVSLDAPATGSNVSFTLPGSVGTSGQLLSTDGSGVLSFVNGGKILQIVRDTDTSERTTTSASYVDVTGVSVTITPQKSDSAIILIAAFVAQVFGSNGYARYAITDASDNIISGTGVQFGDSAGTEMISAQTMIGYATPATTSAVTYKMRFYKVSGGTSIGVRGNLAVTQLYAIEVSA